MSGEGPSKRRRLRSSKSACELVEAPKDLKSLAIGTSEAYKVTIDQASDPVNAALLPLLNSQDERVLEHACSSLAVLSGCKNEQVSKFILDHGLHHRLLELAGHPTLVVSALRTLGNILERNADVIDCFINSGHILDKLRKFLADDRVEVHTQACRIVSYITTGKWRWIQANRDVKASVENKTNVMPGRYKAVSQDDEKTGTTVFSVLCGDTVFSGTDTQRMDPYFGNVASTETVKSYWLCEDVFAVCSGWVKPIGRVTKIVNTFYKSNKPESVSKVATKVASVATLDGKDHPDEKGSSGFIVFGKLSTPTQPEMYQICKDYETDPAKEEYVSNEKYDEAIGGTGRPYVRGVLDRERAYVNECKASGNGLSKLKYLLIRAMEKAKTNDIHTGGPIQMVTVGKRRNVSLFEHFDPLEPNNATSEYIAMKGTFIPKYYVT